MSAVLIVILAAVRDTVRRRTDLEAELLALRHQILVLQRQRGGRRVGLRPADRWLWVTLFRFWARWREALMLVKAETIIACVGGLRRKGRCWRSLPAWTGLYYASHARCDAAGPIAEAEVACHGF